MKGLLSVHYSHKDGGLRIWSGIRDNRGSVRPSGEPCHAGNYTPSVGLMIARIP